MKGNESHGKRILRQVHIWWLQTQAQLAAVVNDFIQLVGVVQVSGKHCRHKGCGIMRLQPGGLVGQQGIGSGM